MRVVASATHARVRYVLCAAVIVLGGATSCGEEASPTPETSEEERARAAAAEVAKNCENPDAPNEACASVEDVFRTSPEHWTARIELFDDRKVCVSIDLRRFRRTGDNLQGVDRVEC
jgi:hypothetical protein